MVIARFLIQDKLESIRFGDKTFLVADISLEAILKMPFLSFSNVDIRIAETSDFT